MYLRMNFLIRLIPDGEENVNIGTGCLAYDDYLPYVGQSIERESCLVIRTLCRRLVRLSSIESGSGCRLTVSNLPQEQLGLERAGGRRLQRNQLTSEFERRK